MTSPRSLHPISAAGVLLAITVAVGSLTFASAFLDVPIIPGALLSRNQVPVTPLLYSREDRREDDEISSDDPSSKYPPLTEGELENRKKEMMLLAKLGQGDKAVAAFKEHWFSERGPEMQRLLTQADFGIGKGPDHWPQAETIFLNLLEKDPTFLEAKVRLSKLYCLQGRFQEAEKLSLQVLDSKPWHFVALETMVAVSTAQGNTLLADLWKARRLPNPSQADARAQWVDRALEDAEEILGRMKDDN